MPPPTATHDASVAKKVTPEILTQMLTIDIAAVNTAAV